MKPDEIAEKLQLTKMRSRKVCNTIPDHTIPSYTLHSGTSRQHAPRTARGSMKVSTGFQTNLPRNKPLSILSKTVQCNTIQLRSGASIAQLVCAACKTTGVWLTITSIAPFVIIAFKVGSSEYSQSVSQSVRRRL